MPAQAAVKPCVYLSLTIYLFVYIAFEPSWWFGIENPTPPLAYPKGLWSLPIPEP